MSNQTEPSDIEPILAAIECTSKEPIDEILDHVAKRLKSDQVKVAGYLQQSTPASENCCATMTLENLNDGSITLISQPLGAGSTGCSLDPSALAGVTGKLQAELTPDIDILILNRFGRGESEGHGFRAAIETATEMNIPVLTAVRNEYKKTWLEFTGDFTKLLPANANDVFLWCQSVVKTASKN